MRVENGIAAMDDCGDCQQSYMDIPNGGVTYVATYADTVGAEGMFVLAGSAMDIASNPGWNASCIIDCMGVANGLAAVDDSSCCHQSYMYVYPGGVTSIETLRDTVGLEGLLILAGSAEDIANNPLWNTGCK
jgi:hypothetical protein